MSADAMFERILGVDFAALPPSVRHLHATSGARRYVGHGDVERGRNPIAALCCVIARLPPAHSGPMCVDMQSTPDAERWVRRFSGHRMPSHFKREGSGLVERLGALRFVFDLVATRGVLQWRVRSVHAFGVALPRGWFGGVGAREFERDGRYRYDVFARLPLVGLLVRYQGWLDAYAAQPIDPSVLDE